MRKLASQVPESVSRLVRSTLLKTPPTWYTPVLSNPPPIQPPRSTASRYTRLPNGTEVPRYGDVRPRGVNVSAEGRTKTHQMKHLREKKPRVEQVVYEEDRIRRRFFMDFPFEALRPTSLVEGRDVRGEEEEGVTGTKWERLEQRGAFPTVESTIAFTLNLHRAFRKPMSEAYEIATSQFSALRARHELATLAAETEARAYGAKFKNDPFERYHAKENAALATLATYTTSTSSSTPSAKYRNPARWSASTPAAVATDFTGGQQYAAKWRLPPPLDVASPVEAGQSPATGGSEAGSSPADGERRLTQAEEEMDDEAFIRQELAVPAQSRARA